MKLSKIFLIIYTFEGDIALSKQSILKLLNTTSDADYLPVRAYTDSSVDLWDRNIVNGEYIIAYEISSGLDYKIQELLPKVRFESVISQVMIH